MPVRHGTTREAARRVRVRHERHRPVVRDARCGAPEGSGRGVRGRRRRAPAIRRRCVRPRSGVAWRCATCRIRPSPWRSSLACWRSGARSSCRIPIRWVGCWAARRSTAVSARGGRWPSSATTATMRPPGCVPSLAPDSRSSTAWRRRSPTSRSPAIRRRRSTSTPCEQRRSGLPSVWIWELRRRS